jgi:gliding motility associated protien GldN
MKKLVAFLVGSVIGASAVMAQDAKSKDSDGYNHLSTKRIHESDIMYKKTITRALDLRELQNLPLFSQSKQITKLIIEAVQAGILTPYSSDSLDGGAKLTQEEFMKKIELPSTDAPGGEDEGGFDEFGDETEVAAVEESSSNYFFPQDLYQMEIKEDLLFDKQRSVLYYDIQSFTFKVPADHPDNIKGIEIPIASFSYKELIEKVFPNNPDAVWYNPMNDSEHHNLADAFELRLFSSYIIKISNANDEYLTDTYGGDPKTGIMASQWKAFELLEYEHNLWEF